LPQVDRSGEQPQHIPTTATSSSSSWRYELHVGFGCSCAMDTNDRVGTNINNVCASMCSHGSEWWTGARGQPCFPRTYIKLYEQLMTSVYVSIIIGHYIRVQCPSAGMALVGAPSSTNGRNLTRPPRGPLTRRCTNPGFEIPLSAVLRLQGVKI
jgi:hypothetical protein